MLKQKKSIVVMTKVLVGHLVGFTVTLGGFKVDGEGEDRWNIQKR